MFFKEKKVLLIGGTGTIGQSLLRWILAEEPTVVRIFSRDEHKQYLMQDEYGTREEIRFLIGDVRDYDRVYKAMEDIDYVFHVAAMKHVPSCEYNPYEAVMTNIVGTHHVIRAAIARKVKKVVFTSSDKAISPTNTYGATKLTAERLVAAAQYSRGRSQTTFATVRFGNVMGSRGSVIPLFVKQILENQRITVTNLAMSRFMMTLDQATRLTIKALKESKGGEVFVLKMPVVILKDLVAVVVEETCKKYQIAPEQIKIDEIGLRKGEKMYEELMTYDESTIAWELPDMFVIPSLFTDEYQYSAAKQASPGSYTSNTQEPLSLGLVRELIQGEKLI
ncbi:polysaccharide biosynthesis protein [Brevibacillus humidisoli]|uniref:SDR family NAD(P)-dependent oxidoreductase n=1 Tax=Brevibacillus humidisoli TaxID=2895522 RepID=UPI001E5E103B|nr:SDR family NAD(P)-dependent oxidoreductase [Brevibacillus humidisoli]UFJ42523.1 polysaccharide biosynthesis protein [Brevibacillus humidisoli]